MSKTIYLNLEDDVTKVVNKLKREKTDEVVLVFPKQSFIFSDSINLRLLKKQLDMIGKHISILTMDERGRTYAQEAGFKLKSMPRSVRSRSFSDIRPRTAPVPETITEAVEEAQPFSETLKRRLKRPTAAAAAARTVAPTSSTAPTSRLKKIARSAGLSTSASSQSASAVTRTRSISNTPPLSVTKQDNVYIPPASAESRPPKRRSNFRIYAVGFVALALIVVLLLVLVVLPSASIVAFAKSQSVARDLEVIADTKTLSAQSSNLTVPAIAVNEVKTTADTFQVNGKKEVGGKAEGRVALYNLTGQPLALKASTTTLTVGNKSYVFKSDQPTVKPLTSAANDSGATLADIVATEGGESFNVPAETRVEITNQAFGSQPQLLYAKTVTQVLGGSSRFVSMVTKDDLDSAQRELIKRTVEGINSNLGGTAKLVEGAYTVNVESFTSDKPEGTETQNFSAELKATVTGLAFDENALKSMIRQRLLTTLGAGKNLQEVEKDTVIYQIKNLDLQNGVMQLSIHYESNSKPVIDPVDMKNKIAGKTRQEASDLILANPDVDRVEITVQPAWQSGLPRFSSKIHFEVKE